MATQTVKVPEGTEVVPITGLKYIPQTPGEKKITLRVKPKDGELLSTNNEISTFITVLTGGLNVLFLQGPHFDLGVQVPDAFDRLVARHPGRPDGSSGPPGGETAGELNDDEFTPGRYNVYILSDLPGRLPLPRAAGAARRRRRQRGGPDHAGRPLELRRRGLGERPSSAHILPVNIHPGDGQIEPEGGIKFVPNPTALDNFLFQIGANRAESCADLEHAAAAHRAPTTSASSKATALVFGPDRGRPARAAHGRHRAPARAASLAFGGETWVWARASRRRAGSPTASSGGR